jgi:DNA-binding transcriptional MerR regulator
VKAKDLQRYAAISYRQIDHWCTKGWLVPIGRQSQNPGSGKDREFSQEQADKARLMSCLVSLGFATERAEKIAHLTVHKDAKRLYIGHGVTLLIEPHSH